MSKIFNLLDFFFFFSFTKGCSVGGAVQQKVKQSIGTCASGYYCKYRKRKINSKFVLVLEATSSN
jgi:hypothetical protein